MKTHEKGVQMSIEVIEDPDNPNLAMVNGVFSRAIHTFGDTTTSWVPVHGPGPIVGDDDV